MATADTTKDLVINDERATLSLERHGVALESTWEIDKLATVLRESVPLGDNGAFYIVRALSARITELNNIIMSTLDDDLEKTADLAYRLRLERDAVLV